MFVNSLFPDLGREKSRSGDVSYIARLTASIPIDASQKIYLTGCVIGSYVSFRDAEVRSPPFRE